jgi:hypothetical protein
VFRIARPRTRLASALRRLEQALATDPRGFGEQARAFARRHAFHQYSPLNRHLIALQRPDASFVMGRAAWLRTTGRTVRKGARSIHVVAPALGRGQGGTTYWFKHVALYDLADTEGPPFTPPSLGPVLGEDQLLRKRLADLELWITESGLSLVHGTPWINSLVLGATDGRTVWVRPDLGPGDRLAVLAHEIAHVKLHFTHRKRGKSIIADEEGERPSRDERELEAELTAFLLLELSGIDSARPAAGYLNSWRASARAVREHAQRCFAVACNILRACECQSFTRLVKDDTVVGRATRRSLRA